MQLLASEQLPEGVQIRAYAGTTMGIRIAFTYRGVFCRETLKNIPADKKGIRYADRLRAEILSKIERQQFNYAEYFPHSKRAHAWGMQNKNALIKDLLQKIQEEDKETN